jgi:hypothetical protein
MDNQGLRASLGCLAVCLTIIGALPLWFALLFGILYHLDAPSWMWVCYFCYVPVTIINAILIKTVEYFRD